MYVGAVKSFIVATVEECEMELSEKFERYLDHVSEGLGRSERKAGLKRYCGGLMLPLKRKSMKPLAAAIDPEHVQALPPVPISAETKVAPRVKTELIRV